MNSVFAVVDLPFPIPLFWSSCLNAHVAPLEHDPSDGHCAPAISFLSVTRLGRRDWDCCVLRDLFLFLRVEKLP